MTRIRTKVKWDLKKINQRIGAVLTDIGEELSPELTQQFDEAVYKWKGPEFFTRRQNGQRVSEPRNIVDTGALRDSQQWKVRKNKTLIFGWGGGFVNYAGAVFFGLPYDGANGPGRDWVTPVLQRYDIWGRFAALWKARAEGQ
jgi:hypothetical protein